MIGTKRLRCLAGAWDEWGLGGSLTEIADQIERELVRHDEPDSTDKGARLPYVTDEDRETLEWVRKYGGIGCVQTMAATLGDTLNWIRERVGIGEDEVVDYDELLDALDRRLMPEGYEWPRYESGELVQIGDDVIGRCGDDPIKVRSVEFRDGDIYLREGFKTDRVVIVYPGERVKRPVLAADGEPLEVGQTVWFKTSGRKMRVDKIEYRPESFCPEGFWALELFADGSKSNAAPVSVLTHQRPVLDALGNRIEPAMDVWWVCEGDERGVHAEKLHVESIGEDGLVTCDPFNGGTWVELEPSELYVHKPVLDANGVPIKVGDTVWSVNDGTEYEVGGVRDTEDVDGDLCKIIECSNDELHIYYVCIPPDKLTHTKPEIDSWERIEEDALNFVEDNSGIPHDQDQMERDMLAILRRCRALAERERSE